MYRLFLRVSVVALATCAVLCAGAAVDVGGLGASPAVVSWLTRSTTVAGNATVASAAPSPLQGGIIASGTSVTRIAAFSGDTAWTRMPFDYPEVAQEVVFMSATGSAVSSDDGDDWAVVVASADSVVALRYSDGATLWSGTFASLAAPRSKLVSPLIVNASSNTRVVMAVSPAGLWNTTTFVLLYGSTGHVAQSSGPLPGGYVSMSISPTSHTSAPGAVVGVTAKTLWFYAGGSEFPWSVPTPTSPAPSPHAAAFFTDRCVLIPASAGTILVYGEEDGVRYVNYAPPADVNPIFATSDISGPFGVACVGGTTCGPAYAHVTGTLLLSWIWLGRTNGVRQLHSVDLRSAKVTVSSTAVPLTCSTVALGNNGAGILCFDFAARFVLVDPIAGTIVKYGNFSDATHQEAVVSPTVWEQRPQVVQGAPFQLLLPQVTTAGASDATGCVITFDPIAVKPLGVMATPAPIHTAALMTDARGAVMVVGSQMSVEIADEQPFVFGSAIADSVPTALRFNVSAPGPSFAALDHDTNTLVVTGGTDLKLYVDVFDNVTGAKLAHASLSAGDSFSATSSTPIITPDHIYVRTSTTAASPARHRFWCLRRRAAFSTAATLLATLSNVSISAAPVLVKGLPPPATDTSSTSGGPAVEPHAAFAVAVGTGRVLRLSNGTATTADVGFPLVTQATAGDTNVYSSDAGQHLVAIERGARFSDGLRWRSALPQRSGDAVSFETFVYSAAGPNVYCTNKVTGLAVWVVNDPTCNFTRVDVCGKLVVATCVHTNGTNVSTAQVYGILSGFWSFSGSGSTIEWKAQMPKGIPPLGPVAYGDESDLLVFPHSKGLVAVSRSNGTVMWDQRDTDLAGCTQVGFNSFFNIDVICPAIGFAMLSPQNGGIWRRLPPGSLTAADSFVRGNSTLAWVHLPAWNDAWVALFVVAKPPGLEAAQKAAAAESNWCHTRSSDADQAPCLVKQVSYRCLQKVSEPDQDLSCPTKFNFPCPQYHYCPVTSSFEQKAFKCPSGGYCPGNTSCVLPCPAGYFCGEGRDPTPCPAGSVCPASCGSPHNCSIIDFCVHEEKQYVTRAQYFALGVIGAVAVLITLGVTCQKLCAKDDPNAGSEKPGMVQHSEAHALRHGPKGDDAANLMFKCADVHHSAWNGKRILRGVTCGIRRKQFTVLMGPSGSGKTSLLNVLSGRAWKQGRVSRHSAWRNIETSPGEWEMQPLTWHLVQQQKTQTGFVPQDDIMHRQCTVGEVLRFQALSRTNARSDSVDEQIAQELSRLGVAREKLSTIVGDELRKGISGGQRKRVSVAMELLPSPAVLFLDEPTSGLDSKSSLDLCHILKGLSRHLTVVAVMHQPSREMLETMDNIILLHRGRVSYDGPVRNILDWSARVEKGGQKMPEPRRLHNPIDAYMDQLTDDATVDAAVAANQPGLQSLRPQVRYGVLIRNNITRSMRIMYGHDRDQLVVELVLWIVGCALVSYALPKADFNDFQTQSAMGSGLLLTLFAQYSCIKVFAPHYERAIADREFRAGLKVFPYFLGKFVAILPKVVLLPAIFILQFAVIDPPVSLWVFFTILLGESFASFSYGLLLSAILDEQLALTFAVLSGFVFLVLSGFNPCLDTLWNTLPWETPMKIITGASPVRWAFDALSSEGYESTSEFSRLCAVPKTWECGFVPTEPLWEKVGMMPALGCIYLILAVIALQWRRFRDEAGVNLSAIRHAVMPCCDDVDDTLSPRNERNALLGEDMYTRI